MKLIAGLLIFAVYSSYVVWSDAASDGSAAATATNAAAAAGLSVAEHLIFCKCKPNYDPVCGTDGITYSNECILNCVSDDHIHNGRHPTLPVYRGACRALNCKCSLVFQPVCGTNNHTYMNDCFLACDNARCIQTNVPTIGMAYIGVCRKAACRCSDSIISVCGTDGKTYRNICILQCYSRIYQAHNLPAIFLRSSGACKSETCHCSKIKSQVCASDGNSYHNQCVLDCQNRRRNQLGQDSLIIKYPGECNNCVCPLNIDPVCASDNKTYNNFCSLLYENHKRKRADLPDLTVLWHGPCNCACTQEWRPVCATDHKTWPNQCQLDCDNRRRIRQNLPSLKLLYQGDCRLCNCGYCSNEYEPACGSDRRSYRNPCFLDCNSNCLVSAGRSPIFRIDNKECYNLFSSSF